MIHLAMWIVSAVIVGYAALYVLSFIVWLLAGIFGWYR